EPRIMERSAPTPGALSSTYSLLRDPDGVEPTGRDSRSGAAPMTSRTNRTSRAHHPALNRRTLFRLPQTFMSHQRRVPLRVVSKNSHAHPLSAQRPMRAAPSDVSSSMADRTIGVSIASSRSSEGG